MPALALAYTQIVVTVSKNHMVQYVFVILAFGCVYALPPLTLTWVPNIVSSPAEKRAVAIALVNSLGNSELHVSRFANRHASSSLPR